MPEVVSAYDEDPACGFNFTLNGYQNLFYLLYNTYDEEGWIKRQPSLPVLFIAGEQDPCIVSRHAWMKAIQKMQAAGYVNLTFKLYEGARHEILNEKCRGEVITDLIRWTDSICTDFWKSTHNRKNRFFHNNVHSFLTLKINFFIIFSLT